MKVYMIKQDEEFFVGFYLRGGKLEATFSPINGLAFLTEESVSDSLKSLEGCGVHAELVTLEQAK